MTITEKLKLIEEIKKANEQRVNEWKERKAG